MSVSSRLLSCFSLISSARSLSRSLEVQIDIIDLLFGAPHFLTHEGICISEFTVTKLAGSLASW